jgi:2-C-methyl-D-erythritol 4-phosphate cytidylyltransferase
MIDALIVAAGKGRRMKTRQPKQFMELAGQPILSRALKAFDRHAEIDRIFVVLPETDIADCRASVIAQAALNKEVKVVAGGKHRQASVMNGLQSIPDQDGIVLIHDGVRPLVTQTLISACIDGARKWGACIPAIEAFDTLKKVHSDGTIEQTVPRQRIVMAQTPQAFRLALIRQAHETAVRLDRLATDDASLLEQMGAAVHVIAGSRHNLKVTRPEDFALAEAYLKSRGENTLNY